MDLSKNLKNPFEMRGGDPDAIVLEPNPHLILEPFAANPDLRSYARRHELDGVAQEIRDALSEISFVTDDPVQRLFQDDIGPGRLEFRMVGQDFRDEPLEVHWSQGDFALGNSAVREHVLNERIEPLGSPGDALQ